MFYYGQPLGAILAKSREVAKQAARLVKVQYEDCTAVTTIEQAIQAGTLYDWEKTLKEGDVSQGFQEADHVLEGTVRTGAQEHYYLETQACLVVPAGEDNELDIYSPSQFPSLLQVNTIVHAKLYCSHFLLKLYI